MLLNIRTVARSSIQYMRSFMSWVLLSIIHHLSTPTCFLLSSRQLSDCVALIDSQDLGFLF